MAAVAVAADNLRADNCDTTTNLVAIGTGPGVVNETDVVYQGPASGSRKVGTAEKGLYSNTGANRDMTAAGRKTWLCKIWITNYTSLVSGSNFIRARLGSGTSAYYYYEYGSPTVDYPAKGGWVIDAIDPSIAAHRDGNVGSPTLTAMALFGVTALCSVSKTENVALDSVDIGTGLYLTAGDGGSTDGVFDDFTVDDEGDITNGRFGYVTTIDDVLFVLGQLYIGATVASGTRTSAITEFIDEGVSIVFRENKAAAGFSGLTVDLGTSGTVVDLTDCSLNSKGTVAGEDTRAILDVYGTTGTFDMNGGVVSNFASLLLTSACTLDGADVMADGITQASAHIKNGKIRTTSATSVACITSPTFGTTSGIHDTEFIQAGAGHAVELSGIGATVTLTNCTWTGYGADASDSAVIDVTAASGTTTINWSGGTEPTYKTAGATVVRINSVTVAATIVDGATGALIQNAYVLLRATSGGTLPFEDSVTITRSGSTATVIHTAHGLSTSDEVVIDGAVQDEYNGIRVITVTGTNDYTYTVSGTPVTPATGTITSTAVVLNGLTDASGVIQNTGFNFGASQPVTGRAVKGTSTPVYIAQPFSGDIEATGLSVTVPMSRDD